MYHQGVWTKLGMKICFLRQSWTKGFRQIHKIKQDFLWNVLQLIFCDSLPKNVKIWLLGEKLGTHQQIQVF